MRDMQRWALDYDVMIEEEEGQWVKAADAEAAIEEWRQLAYAQGDSYKEGLEWASAEAVRRLEELARNRSGGVWDDWLLDLGSVRKAIVGEL